MVLVNHALLLLVGVVVELAVGDTVLVDGFGTPGKRQTVAHLSGDSVLLADAVNQLLSGESDLHDMLVRREVESILKRMTTLVTANAHNSAVLGLADVLTKSVFSSRRRSPNTSSQGFMEVSFTCISQRTPSNLLKMALMKPSSHIRLYHFTCPSSALRL